MGFLYRLSIRGPPLCTAFFGGFSVCWIALITSRLLFSDLLPVALVVGKVVLFLLLSLTGVVAAFSVAFRAFWRNVSRTSSVNDLFAIVFFNAASGTSFIQLSIHSPRNARFRGPEG